MWTPEDQGPAAPSAKAADALDRSPPEPRSAAPWIILLVLYGLCLNLPYLGSEPLMSHEVLVAQRTEGLMNHGHWVVPYRDGRPDFNKPPLPFWITGGLSLLTGRIDEWTLRLPSVAATIGTMLLLVFYVRRLRGWRMALVTGWVFVTSAAAVQYSRRAEVDMLLTFWTSLSLLAYVAGLGAASRRRQVAWFVTMWLAAGIAVLSKGPLPLGILLATMILVAVFCPEGRRVGRMLPIIGPLLLLAIAAAWGIPVVLTHPDAVSTWYMQSLGRFAGEMGHDKPFYYYVLHAPTLWLPWILPVGVGFYLLVKRQALPRLHVVFLLAWGLAGLAMLSASTGKRVHYALPVTPPLLVLAGIGLDYIVFTVPRKLTRSQTVLFWLHMLVIPGILAGALVGMAYLPEYSGRLLALALVSAALLNLVFWLYHANRRLASLLVLAAGFLVVVVAGVAVMVTPMSLAIAREASIGRAIAARPDDPVCKFIVPSNDAPGDSTSIITFYAGRRLPVVRSSDDMRRWRAAHPGGLVLVPKQDAAALRQLGAWDRPLPPEDPRWAESEFELLAVPPEAAAGSSETPGLVPGESKEVSDAE